jgi:hypothetical protein
VGPTNVAWRGLTLGNGTLYRLDTVEGWEERPPGRYNNTPRTRAHGSHRSQVLADERIVTVTGWAFTPEQRDELLEQLQDVSGFGDVDDTEPLTITAAGRTLTAGAQLIRAVPSLNRGQWGAGWFGWLLQWRCPDPLRYGPARTVGPVGLPTDGGGLTYPLSYPLGYGTAGETGRVALANAGTAPAPIVFAVRGDLPGGAELSAAATGQRLTYAQPIPGQQLVEIDTAAGTVLVEGTSSRRAALISADWLHVPARSQLTVQFTSLSLEHAGTAQLVATTQDTYW